MREDVREMLMHAERVEEDGESLLYLKNTKVPCTVKFGELTDDGLQVIITVQDDHKHLLPEVEVEVSKLVNDLLAAIVEEDQDARRS